jgi:hypothetical protein
MNIEHLMCRVRRPGHRQRVCRPVGAGSADHGRLGRSRSCSCCSRRDSEQTAPKRFIRIRKPVEVRDGDKVARFEPHDGFRIGFTVVFDHPAIPAAQSRAESTSPRLPTSRK